MGPLLPAHPRTIHRRLLRGNRSHGGSKTHHRARDTRGTVETQKGRVRGKAVWSGRVTDGGSERCADEVERGVEGLGRKGRVWAGDGAVTDG